MEKPVRSASGTRHSGSPHMESKPHTSSPAARARASPDKSDGITWLKRQHLPAPHLQPPLSLHEVEVLAIRVPVPVRAGAR